MQFRYANIKYIYLYIHLSIDSIAYFFINLSFQYQPSVQLYNLVKIQVLFLIRGLGYVTNV